MKYLRFNILCAPATMCLFLPTRRCSIRQLSRHSPAPLLVELYSRPLLISGKDDFNFTVRLHYRTAPEQPLASLHVPGCSLECPLNQLRKILREVIPLNLTAECFDLSAAHQKHVMELELRQHILHRARGAVGVGTDCDHCVRRATTKVAQTPKSARFDYQALSMLGDEDNDCSIMANTTQSKRYWD